MILRCFVFLDLLFSFLWKQLFVYSRILPFRPYISTFPSPMFFSSHFKNVYFCQFSKSIYSVQTFISLLNRFFKFTLSICYQTYVVLVCQRPNIGFVNLFMFPFTTLTFAFLRRHLINYWIKYKYSDTMWVLDFTLLEKLNSHEMHFGHFIEIQW